MAEETSLKEGETVISKKELASISEQLADLQKALVDRDAKMAGLEEMFATSHDADTTGEKKLRERKDFEPAFRTVRLRKYPMNGDVTNLGYVVGWSNRGAYHKVDRNGVAPVLVDWIDIIFLGHERNEKGVLQAEAVPLLDLLNRGEQVHCKVIDKKSAVRKEPTGEEINITIWDPKHGLVSTNETIDGWVSFTDVTFSLQVPGIAEPVEVDSKYAN